jgi:hypothetical protein
MLNNNKINKKLDRLDPSESANFQFVLEVDGFCFL